jgi:hypothetical protein
MYESNTAQLERSPTAPGLGPQGERLAPTSDCRGHGCQRRRRQPMAEAGSERRPYSLTAPASPWSTSSTGHRAAGPSARAIASWPGSLRIPRPSLDPKTRGRSDTGDVRRRVPPYSCGPPSQSAPLEPPETGAASPAARRSRDRPLAHGNLAGDQKGAEAQDQTILFIDESGFYPLPSVVRTYAPVGHTPILREWWTRDHLSAISQRMMLKICSILQQRFLSASLLSRKSWNSLKHAARLAGRRRPLESWNYRPEH